MLSLLQSFTAVLDEFGVSHSRAKNAAFCAAEGLIKVSEAALYSDSNDLYFQSGWIDFEDFRR